MSRFYYQIEILATARDQARYGSISLTCWLRSSCLSGAGPRDARVPPLHPRPRPDRPYPGVDQALRQKESLHEAGACVQHPQGPTRLCWSLSRHVMKTRYVPNASAPYSQAILNSYFGIAPIYMDFRGVAVTQIENFTNIGVEVRALSSYRGGHIRAHERG